jgi:hypothetical protein
MLTSKHVQGLIGSPYQPHGQGFIAATSMELAGNVSVPAARLMVINFACRY